MFLDRTYFIYKIIQNLLTAKTSDLDDPGRILVYQVCVNDYVTK